MCSLSRPNFATGDITTDEAYQALYYRVVSGDEFYSNETDLEMLLGGFVYNRSNSPFTITMQYLTGKNLYPEFINQMHRLGVLGHFYTKLNRQSTVTVSV